MTAVKYLTEYLIECAMIFLTYAASVMTIHCFSDERLALTRKKHLIAGAVVVVCEALLFLKLSPIRISVDGYTFVTIEHKKAHAVLFYTAYVHCKSFHYR